MGTIPETADLERDKLMLDIEKLRRDLKKADEDARHQDRIFLLDQRRTNATYAAAGAGITAAMGTLIGALNNVSTATVVTLGVVAVAAFSAVAAMASRRRT